MDLSKRKAHRGLFTAILVITSMGLGDLSLHGLTALWEVLGVLVLILASILAVRYTATLTAGMFVVLILGEVLGDRAFSHLVIGKPPFYITEMGMFTIATLLIVQRKLKLPKSIRSPFLLLMALCIIAAVINVFTYPWSSVLRDSAELYYMVFIPLSYSIYKIFRPYLNRSVVEKSIIAIAYITPAFYLVTRSFQIPASTEAVAASLIVFQISWDWQYAKREITWPNILLNLVVLAEGGARGPWIGFIISLLVLLVASRWIPQANLRVGIRYRLLVLLFIMFTAFILMAIISPFTLINLEHDLESVTSLSGSYVQVANNRWRLIIWLEAFRQFMSNPLALRVGQNWVPLQLIELGYGGTNTTGYGLNTVALSNSYLQMMQWYGLWAAVPFWWLIATIGRRLFRHIPYVPAAYSLVAIMSIWAINCAVEVVLEGPYMSAIIWSIVGFGLAYLEER